ncbi:Uncharacterised protein [Yersinia ruckeri]|nr:hypothetical protein QMA0440_02004 [Yersinia ruckeri]KFE38860.1 hypothetical protein nADLYRO1b_1763 [Yersinia ruckeri]CNB23015.1 Uncharacterised protein [Yersinia ruckeri]
MLDKNSVLLYFVLAVTFIFAERGDRTNNQCGVKNV